ncbi:putative bifunctional diguanylate cyclase/phosphodiesterase [Acidocella sp.]|uniref:putative bifunctional diguanylate cyclase/phosphodiesterase n=1 Tax=Acidocella sp. TaxID=50710 RepID=UPI003D03DDB7
MQIPPDLSERLFLDQAKDFSYVIRAISMVGLNTLALIFLDFHDNPGVFWRNIILLLTAAVYVVIILRGQTWLRRSDTSGRDAAQYFRQVSAVLVALGLLWGVLLVLLMAHGSPNQRSLIYAVAVGCIATPVLVSPPSCAISYWAPTSLGAMISLMLYDADPYAMTDLIAFVALTGFCILYLNRRMNERAIGAIRLEENAEVIRLLLRDFEESASDWLWETNAQLEMQPVSQRLVQVARRPAESFHGVFPEVLLGEEALRAAQPGSAAARLQHAIAEHSPFRDLVIPVNIEGELRYWSLTGKPILDKNGRFGGYHGVGSDITGQRRQQEHISFLARHDSLTKLANRMLFSEVLHQCCEKAGTTGFALLCLDLDNFKIINDTLGHATGDAVLVAVAERLKGSIREFDIASRLGGDEFAIIVVTSERSEAQAIAGRIVERIMRPFRFDGQFVQIGISIGIAMAPQDGTTPTQLMKCADLALYRAKNDGRGIVRIYDPEMDEAMQARRSLQAALRQALPRGELFVSYQPIVDLMDNRITGAEALVRWEHPKHGIIPPSQFIPLAEESGLIEDIGTFVLHSACSAAASWPLDITVAVNLSPLQSRDPQIVDTITNILASTGLPASRLELEVVESTILEAGSPTEEALKQLRGHGVRIALDDFGTGYSSLSYLRSFPFGKLKIDRSFIRDIGYEKAGSSIILAIIGLAESMNMLVTAEGVENVEQAELLRSYGCAQAQGFLFHQPMSAEDFAQLLDSQASGGNVASAPHSPAF